MVRKFNSTGLCVPRKHYMVDITGRLEQIRGMVDEGDYFCINRARQYGKTTTLAALKRYLANDYVVASLDFQAFSHASFRTEGAFVQAFAEALLDAHELGGLALSEEALRSIRGVAEADSDGLSLGRLLRVLRNWIRASSHPVVLMVDEVDTATNNQVFLDFLAQLRLQYLLREDDPSYPAFHSVILAGVTGIKHLKAKIRPEETAKVNSPWNIAADFNVDMSFSVEDVVGMLGQYELDHVTGMDVVAVANEIVAWTGGYPFLVSRLCQLVDERGLGWDHAGIDAAVKLLLSERNTLFESLTGKLENGLGMRTTLRAILMDGKSFAFNPYQEEIAQLAMHGFVRDNGGRLAVSNRVFETLLYNLFLSDEELAGSRLSDAGELGRNRFVRNGRLDMRAILEGFRRTYEQVFGPLVDRFPERDGRELFLLYLKPIINGTGNYYIEAQTRDQTKTDVVVDYMGEQFVVELKVWRGPRYNEAGEEQLRGYLEYFGLNVGYMLSFNFNKHKEPGLHRVDVDGKTLWEETI